MTLNSIEMLDLLPRLGLGFALYPWFANLCQSSDGGEAVATTGDMAVFGAFEFFAGSLSTCRHGD